jgi:hypothetical protein
MRIACAIIALAIALPATLFTPAARSANSTASYMHIVQKHHTLGDLDIYASPTISVLLLKKNGCELYFDAKNKSVLLISQSNKLFIKLPVAKFDHRFGRTLSAASDLDVNPKHWRMVGPTALFGHKALVFSTVSQIPTYKKSSNSFLQNRDGSMNVATKLIVFRHPYLLPDFCQLVTKMQEAPDVGGIPVSMETYFSRVKNSINTTKIAIEKTNPKIAPPLTGFKPAKSTEEIFFGSYDLLNDLLNQ